MGRVGLAPGRGSPARGVAPGIRVFMIPLANARWVIPRTSLDSYAQPLGAAAVVIQDNSLALSHNRPGGGRAGQEAWNDLRRQQRYESPDGREVALDRSGPWAARPGVGPAERCRPGV